MLKLMKCRGSNLISWPIIVYVHPLVVRSYYHTGLQKRSVGILYQLICRILNILTPFFDSSLRASFVFSKAKAICMRVGSPVFERDTGEAPAAPITWTCCVLSPFDIFTQKLGIPRISGPWGSSSRPNKSD